MENTKVKQTFLTPRRTGSAIGVLSTELDVNLSPRIFSFADTWRIKWNSYVCYTACEAPGN